VLRFSGDRIQVLDAQRTQDSRGSAAPLSHGLLVLAVGQVGGSRSPASKSSLSLKPAVPGTRFSHWRNLPH
jgi:hypothetical protein